MRSNPDILGVCCGGVLRVIERKLDDGDGRGLVDCCDDRVGTRRRRRRDAKLAAQRRGGVRIDGVPARRHSVLCALHGPPRKRVGVRGEGFFVPGFWRENDDAVIPFRGDTGARKTNRRNSARQTLEL